MNPFDRWQIRCCYKCGKNETRDLLGDEFR